MSNFDTILNFDPFANAEKMFSGKHWSQFNDEENSVALGISIFHNQYKEEFLKQQNDTYFSMGWNNFLNLIKSNGFICGLKYDIKHDNNIIDEAIIYYHPDGLIIWATSYNNKKSVNGGTLYGEFQYNNWNDDIRNALEHCSHGNINDKNERYFSKDVREGLFHTIGKIASHTKLSSIWSDRNKFLWFVDYVENKVDGYDFKEITEQKISLLPKEAQKIINR